MNSAKFLITHFLKNPSDGSFCINTRSVNCSTKTLVRTPPFSRGGINFDYLPARGEGGRVESEKLKKGSGSMVLGQVSLKRGGS